MNQGYSLLFVLLPILSSVAKSQLCNTNTDDSADDLFNFAEQPQPHCSTVSISYQLECVATTFKATAVWHVHLPEDPATNLAGSSLASVATGKATNSTLTVACSDGGGCSFRIRCQLFNNNQSIITSPQVDVHLGQSSCNDEPSQAVSLIIPTKLKSLLLRAVAMSHVILPCLGIVLKINGPILPEQLLGSSWFFNGSQLPEIADGVFNIDRHIQDNFFVWSNLTIFHVTSKHAGYYQCFIDEHEFSVIRLQVDGLAHSHQNNRLPPFALPMRPQIVEASFDNKLVQLTLKDFALLNEPSRRLAIGIIRHRRSSSADVNSSNCLGELGQGATTYFISVYLATSEGNDSIKIAFDQLPDTFLIDALLCRDSFWYSVFVKSLVLDHKVTVTSTPVVLPFPDDFESSATSALKEHETLEVIEQKSGSSFVCFHAINNANMGSFAEIDNQKRLIAPLALSAAEPKQQEVRAIPSCTCHRDKIDTSGEHQGASELSLEVAREFITQVPFVIGSLTPNMDYCIQVMHDCYSYRTALGSSVLSYERLAGSAAAIAVTWQLPMCRSLASRLCHVIVRQLLSVDETMASFYQEQLIDQCTGRTVFSDFQGVNNSLEIVITCDKIDLASKVVPAQLRVENISVSLVSLSRMFIHWTTNEPSSEGVPNFAFYACPFDAKLPTRTAAISEESSLLLCLGCHQLRTLAVFTGTSTTNHYAEVTGFDQHVRRLKIVISAEVAITTQGEQDSTSLGILGETATIFNSQIIDNFRPTSAAIDEIGGEFLSWNVTWASPEFFIPGFALHSFEIVAKPISNLLDGEYENGATIKAETASTSQAANLFIANVSEMVLESHHYDLVAPCVKLPPDEYLIQVFPIWTAAAAEAGMQQMDELVEFVGAPSLPMLLRSRLRRVIEFRYGKSSNNDNNNNLLPTAHLKTYYSNSLVAPLVVSAAISFVLCLVFVIPYFNKN